jgi:hypothetical protein
MRLVGLMGSLVLLAAPNLGAGALTQQPGGPPPSSKPPVRLTPAEINLYERARTLMDWTPRQIGSFPSLDKLRPAESQGELPAILEQVGRAAVRVFGDLVNISCDEDVSSRTNTRGPFAPGEWLRGNEVLRHFRYIIIPRPAGAVPLFEEYRTDRAGRPVELTSGPGIRMFFSKFTGSWIHFSPSDQPYNRFRYLGTQAVKERECYVVGFAQDPKLARLITVFWPADPPAALLLQGLAWIDKQSFRILRIETWLLAERSDIGLDAQNTVVNYFPVRPVGLDRDVWVPHDVSVTTLFRGSMIENTHRYSNFQLFRVESTIKPAE